MNTGYNLHEGALMLAERIKADPPRRADGLCAYCEKPLNLPPKSHHRAIDPMVYLSEPFCSGECCRAWHGIERVQIPFGDPNERRGRYQRKAA